MNRRTFFQRTVGALATAAIAPQLPVTPARRFGPGVVGFATHPAAAYELVMVQRWEAFDWRFVASALEDQRP